MAQTHASDERGHTAPDDISDAALREALQQVPRGALALAGTALAFVLAAWLLVYFAIYLPRPDLRPSVDRVRHLCGRDRLGAWQMWVRSPLPAPYAEPYNYFVSVMLHGTAIAYVLPTFFIMGFGYYVAETVLDQPLPGRGAAWPRSSWARLAWLWRWFPSSRGTRPSFTPSIPR